ncbi:MAG: hypothetical protein U9R02_12100 [Thermodesulfobacteriota bacterium]|nr:hypothetical protein [Thermodesulfobacteriota bacterium]
METSEAIFLSSSSGRKENGATPDKNWIAWLTVDSPETLLLSIYAHK